MSSCSSHAASGGRGQAPPRGLRSTQAIRTGHCKGCPRTGAVDYDGSLRAARRGRWRARIPWRRQRHRRSSLRPGRTRAIAGAFGRVSPTRHHSLFRRAQDQSSQRRSAGVEPDGHRSNAGPLLRGARAFRLRNDSSVAQAPDIRYGSWERLGFRGCVLASSCAGNSACTDDSSAACHRARPSCASRSGS